MNWRSDATQHIHVEPSIPEQEVLRRAMDVAQRSAHGQKVCLDIFPMQEFPCPCHPPADWKTYVVIIHAEEKNGLSEKPGGKHRPPPYV